MRRRAVTRLGAADVRPPACETQGGAIRWLNSPPRDDDAVTPFKILEKLMERELPRHRLRFVDPERGLAQYPVPPDDVANLYPKLLALAVEHATGTDVRRALGAVELLAAAWRQPLTYVLDCDAASALWRPYDKAILDALRHIATATAEPFVRLHVRAAVSFLAWYGQDPAAVAAACTLITTLDTAEFDLVSAEILDAFRRCEMVPRGEPFLQDPKDLTGRRFEFLTEHQHAQERRRAVDLLWAHCEDPESVVNYLDQRLRTARHAGLPVHAAGPFILAATQARPHLGRRLADALQSLTQSPLSYYLPS